MKTHSDYSESEPDSPTEAARRGQLFLPGDPIPEPSEASLEDAIDTAPVEELRDMVKELVRRHTDVKDKDTVSKRLLAPMSTSYSRKPKAFEACLHSGEDYAVANNHDGCCIHRNGTETCCFHPVSAQTCPGSKEPDFGHDLLEDHFRGAELNPDDPEMKDAFYWTCCGRYGNAAPCIVTRHTPLSADIKRMRPAVSVT